MNSNFDEAHMLLVLPMYWFYIKYMNGIQVVNIKNRECFLKKKTFCNQHTLNFMGIFFFTTISCCHVFPTNHLTVDDWFIANFIFTSLYLDFFFTIKYPIWLANQKPFFSLHETASALKSFCDDWLNIYTMMLCMSLLLYKNTAAGRHGGTYCKHSHIRFLSLTWLCKNKSIQTCMCVLRRWDCASRCLKVMNKDGFDLSLLISKLVVMFY